jgi:hypothetical protein
VELHCDLASLIEHQFHRDAICFLERPPDLHEHEVRAAGLELERPPAGTSNAGTWRIFITSPSFHVHASAI